MIKMSFITSQNNRRLSRRYYCMVIRDLGIIEHLLTLRYLACKHWSRNIGIWRHLPHDFRNFWIDVVAQVCRIDARIGSRLLLI